MKNAHNSSRNSGCCSGHCRRDSDIGGLRVAVEFYEGKRQRPVMIWDAVTGDMIDRTFNCRRVRKLFGFPEKGFEGMLRGTIVFIPDEEVKK